MDIGSFSPYNWFCTIFAAVFLLFLAFCIVAVTLEKNKKQPRKAWVVSIEHYDHCEIKCICLSEEAALQKFEQVRQELIELNGKRIADDIIGGFDPTEFVDVRNELEKWTPTTLRRAFFWETPRMEIFEIGQMR